MRVDTKTFDAISTTACVCDSKWKVGLKSNETQDGEWFGPDCSLRHCPSGSFSLLSFKFIPLKNRR